MDAVGMALSYFAVFAQLDFFDVEFATKFISEVEVPEVT